VNPRNTPYTRDTKAGPALGLLRLKYWIESRTEHEVDVIHSDVENPYINYSKYDYVGIGSYYPTMKYDLKLGAWIKKTFDVTLIYGGINPTFLPSEYLTTGDIVVRYEGEKALERILEERITEGVVDGPYLSESEWREATFNLPYESAPWKKIWEFNRRRYGVGPAVRLVTISGCRRGCVFCSSTNFIKKIRFLSSDELAALCDRVARFLPPNGIIILQGDDELYGRARRRFFDLYERGYRFPRPVSIQTEVKRIDEETAHVLKELGVFEVCLGVESFSENILREYEKKATVEDNERALDILLRYGFRIYANIILNGLGIYSTKEDVEYTLKRIEYWKRKGKGKIVFGINKEVIPLPGSKYWSILQSKDEVKVK